MNSRSMVALLGWVLVSWGGLSVSAQDVARPAGRLAEARACAEDEEFQKGLDLCRQVVEDPAWDGRDARQWFPLLAKMMYEIDPAKYSKLVDYDAVLEKSLQAHPGNWRVMAAVAAQYQDYRWSWGAVSKKDEIFRCQQACPGGLKVMGLLWRRDRARGLELFGKAVPMMEADAGATPVEKARAYVDYACCLVAGPADAAREMAVIESKSVSRPLLTPLMEDLAPEKSPAASGALWDVRFAGGRYNQSLPPVWPSDASGRLLFPEIPPAFAAAADDVARWRWLLARALELDPSCESEVLESRARFCEPLFGKETLPSAYRGCIAGFEPGSPEFRAWHPSTLADTEALVWANGVLQRSALPDDLNPFVISRRLAELGDRDGALQWCDALEVRGQFGRAAEAWRQLVATHGPGGGNVWQKKLDMLSKPGFSWVRDDRVLTPANPSFSLLVRNGRKLKFSARRFDVGKMLACLRAAPPSAKGSLPRPGYYLDALLRKEGAPAGFNLTLPVPPWKLDEVLSAPVAWEEALPADPGPAGAVLVVKPPFHEAGAWVVEVTLEDGQVVKGFLHVADSVQMEFPGLSAEAEGRGAAAGAPDEYPGGTLRYYFDPASGGLRANSRWLVWTYASRQKRENNALRAEEALQENTVDADACGRIPVPPPDPNSPVSGPGVNRSCFFMRKMPDGSVSLSVPSASGSTGPALGAANSFGGAPTLSELRRKSIHNYWDNGWEPDFWDLRPVVWGVLERPSYVAGETVRGRFWARSGVIPGQGLKAYPFKEVPLNLVPFGNWKKKVRLGTVKLDDPAGFALEYRLPAEAAASAYIVYAGDAPPPLAFLRSWRHTYPVLSIDVGRLPSPVRLLKLESPSAVAAGAAIPISVLATDPQGRPLANAKVNLRVYGRDWQDPRTPESLWTPLCGASASWLASDPDQFPGWREWGWPSEPAFVDEAVIVSPNHTLVANPVPEKNPPASFPWRHQEILLSRPIDLDAQGRFSLSLDTRFFNAFRQGRPLQFMIMAELAAPATGGERMAERTVFSAARPAVLRLATAQGFQRPGIPFDVVVQAYRHDGSPVPGPVEVKIQRVSADADNNPRFEAVETCRLVLDGQGKGILPQKIAKAGQYRIFARILCDQQPVLGGSILLVKDGTDSLDDACFKPLELVVEKGVVSPGASVKLLVNSCHADATVLLFVRGEEGYERVPRIIRLAGKSHEETIDIRPDDPQQIFVHAEMLRDGRRFQAIREIPVQPLEKWLAVVPKTETDSVRKTAKTTVQVLDAAGKPVAGAQVTLNSWDCGLEAGFQSWVFSRRLGQKFGDKPWLRHWPVCTNNLVRQVNLSYLSSISVTAASFMPERERFFPSYPHLVDQITPKAGDEEREQLGLYACYPYRFTPCFQTPLSAADFPCWKSGLVTDAEGKAVVEWPLPDRRGPWRLRASCLASGRRFGDGEETVALPPGR